VFRRKKRTGILYFRMYYSNYYITLTDLSSNVIFSCSAGSVSDTNNKKTKMSNVVAMPIFYRILFFLRAFKIRNLKFVIRNRMDKIFYNALTFFKKRGYKIKSFSFVQKAPHHLGQRKQKPRRI
jgi:ribosomal protein S11